MHLRPFEVLTAINHAPLRLKHTFKEEEFTNSEVGKLMIAEDFDFETTVSFLFYELEFATFWLLILCELEFTMADSFPILSE